MTDLEKQALDALCHCGMKMASNGKRFRNDVEYALKSNPDLKLTPKQALLLWDLVYTYRRQISNPVLIQHGTHVRNTQTLPDIYQPEDHREPVKKESAALQPRRSSRYRIELERGKGKLAL